MSEAQENTGKDTSGLSRRDVLRTVVRGAGVLAIAGGVAGLATRWTRRNEVWQLDPWKCNQCGNCAKKCVLNLSAVKCVQDFVMCGYCELCPGFFRPDAATLNPGAENQLCPVGAIRRKFVEDPYHEYTIDEPLCIGCGVCVKGCTQFGNGSFYLQVRHDRCLNCNECSIAVNCPTRAFRRLPGNHPYIIKHEGPEQRGLKLGT